LAVKVPSPFPIRIEMVLSELFAIARSIFPSPLKSAAINPLGLFPVPIAARLSEVVFVEFVIWKKSTFEFGDPVLATPIEAVPNCATFPVGIMAANRFVLMKVVGLGDAVPQH